MFISGKGQLLIYRSDVTPKSVRGKQKRKISYKSHPYDANNAHLLKESCQSCSDLLSFTHSTGLFGRICNSGNNMMLSFDGIKKRNRGKERKE